MSTAYSNLPFYELEFEIKGEMLQVFPKLNWFLLANERFLFFLVTNLFC